MRQCPFSFAETDDVELCRSCGAYDLAYLEERAAEVKWESHLTAGDPWCELVFAKPPPPPAPELAEEEPEEAPAVTGNGDVVDSTESSTQTAEPQAAVVSAVDSAAEGSEFGSLAQAYGNTAEPADSPEPAAADAPDAAAAAADEAKAVGTGGETAKASASEPAAVETSADGDAGGTAEVAGTDGSGKKETTP